jgi:ribosomal protein S20
VNSLTATERGLREIGRKLNDQEEKTAIQIREFVKQAHQALTTGDVDGANTLAAKAKVLLEELTK